jgi:hypothetical protein
MQKQALLVLFLSQELAKTRTFGSVFGALFAREMLAVIAVLHHPGAM